MGQHRITPGKLTRPALMSRGAYLSGTQRISGPRAWRLFVAAHRGDLSTIDELLDGDSRLVNALYWYQTPLHFAVRAGHIAVVRKLLQHGANVGCSPFLYNSWDRLLRVAADRQQGKIVALLERHLKRKFGFAHEFAKLVSAIEQRSLAKVKSVIRRQPDLAQATDALGNNAIHHSVMTRQLKLIDFFLDHGAKIDAQRADGKTPAQLTQSWFRPLPPKYAISDRSVVLGYLLGHGAEYTLSLAAACGDQERVVELLQQNPASANQLDSASVSPLTYATSVGHIEVAQTLLDNGADPNQPETLAPKGGALFAACRFNEPEAVLQLLEHGADPDGELDSSGCCYTIVEHFHGKQAARPIQRMLLEYGVTIPPYGLTWQQLATAINEQRPVLHHAEFLDNIVKHNNVKAIEDYLECWPTYFSRRNAGRVLCPESPQMAQAFIKHGMSVKATDWLGRTALHDCAEKGDLETAAVLIERGADVNIQESEFDSTPLVSAIRPLIESSSPSKNLYQRQTKMVAFLLQHGAIVPADAPAWADPLALAGQCKAVDIRKLLLEASRHDESSPA